MTQPERRKGSKAAGTVAEAAAAGSAAGTAAGTAAAAAAGGAAAQPPKESPSLQSTLLQMVMRGMLVYLAMNFFKTGSILPKNQAPAAPEGVAVTPNMATNFKPNMPVAAVDTPVVAAFDGPIPEKLYSLWASKTNMDLYVYVSEDPVFTDYNDVDSLVWKEQNLELGDWNDERIKELTITPSKNVQNNGTLYAHIYLAHHDTPIDPANENFNVDFRVYSRKLLTRYFKKKYTPKVKKLIGGSHDPTEPEVDEKPVNKTTIVSYWHQNLTITALGDQSAVPYAALPPEMQALFQIESTGLTDPKGNRFTLPAIYVNDFWLLKDQMFQINDTVTELPMRINFYYLSFLKLQLYASMEVGMKAQESSMMGSTGGELDEIKRTLIETNPYLLLLTLVVSCLHSAFEMLAFKNDIAFWKDKKGTAGLSVRSIFLDIAQQIIVFAYLVDNTQETSYMILVGQAIGLAIEFWKVKKALKVDIVPNTEGGFLPYRLHYNTSEPLTDLEEKTKEYDEEAFKYLSWAAFPLLGCYAVYSLLYEEHKSWYSFIVGTLVGFVYTFGFIKMTPQLFINYKLKSVAHMPFRTMMYKSLNTFIDDLFSFIIKMPMLHRLACLRDDVIFFVYLYQRYKYRMDPTRVNEFGQVAGEEIVAAAAVEAKEEESETKKDK